MRKDDVVHTLLGALMVGVVGWVAASVPPFSQFSQFARQGRMPPMSLATPDSFDGDVAFLPAGLSAAAPWATDYPDADYNFSTRVSELTKTGVSKIIAGEPRPLIVRPI